MAIASTLSIYGRTVPGADVTQPTVLQPDNAYPTNGYPLPPALFGLAVLRRLSEVRPRNIASAAYTPLLVTTEIDGIITAANLVLLVATTAAQVANGTDVSASSFYVIAEGD